MVAAKLEKEANPDELVEAVFPPSPTDPAPEVHALSEKSESVTEAESIAFPY